MLQLVWISPSRLSPPCIIYGAAQNVTSWQWLEKGIYRNKQFSAWNILTKTVLSWAWLLSYSLIMWNHSHHGRVSRKSTSSPKLDILCTLKKILLLIRTNLRTCLTVLISLCKSMLLSEQTATICELKAQTISCSPQQSIVIKEAEYGHIGISECIEVDTGHFGCKIDVSSLLEQKCTGSSCTIDVNGPSLRQMNPCRRGLDVFLKLKYFCVDGKNWRSWWYIW